jgi:phenylacetate-CoA ligase
MGLLRVSRSGVPTWLQKFRELEQASPDFIDEYQRLQLLDLLRHCHAHVPFYRKQIEAFDVDLSDQFDREELLKLPLLTKETIRSEGDGLYSDDRQKRRAFRNSSGGSTGKPVIFLQDRAFYGQSVIAAKFIYNEFLGKGPGESEINLWGSERDISRGSLGARQKLINFIYNRRFQNFFKVDDTRLRRFVEEVNRAKPVSIWAYAESIDLLAKFVRRNKLAVHSPHFIISTAGTLHSGIRDSVQAVFRCPVFNQYGSREFGAIAFEMQDQDGLRGFPYLNHIEIIDGKVIITSLTNYSMPFLRYEIGDTAEPWQGSRNSKLGCTRKVLKTITGRVHSHFKTIKGELIHGLFFTHQFYYLDWVKQFQVVQERVNHISCILVLAAEPVKTDLERVRAHIRAAMGDNCAVEFRIVDQILPSASGKHLYTICKV